MNTRSNVLTALALIATLVSMPRSGNAHYNYPHYPWCAQFADAGGASSCAFANYAQCLASISGIGGLCTPNPEWVFGPPWVQLRPAKVRRHFAHR